MVKVKIGGKYKRVSEEADRLTGGKRKKRNRQQKNYIFFTTKLGKDVIPARNREEAIEKAKARGYKEKDLKRSE